MLPLVIPIIIFIIIIIAWFGNKNRDKLKNQMDSDSDLDGSNSNSTNNIQLYDDPDYPHTNDEMSSVMNCNIGIAHTQGMRGSMEDATSVDRSVDKKTLIIGLYDGHNGKQVSSFAADGIPASYAKYKDLERAFLDVELLLEKSNIDHNRIGSTAVVATIDEAKKNLKVANLGDSRAILVRRGKVALETKDHKPNSTGERVRINELGGYVVDVDGTSRMNGLIAVSRAFGDTSYKLLMSHTPDIYEAELKSDDILILACDGLWDVVSSADVAKFVGAIADKGPHFIAKQLRNMAIEKHSSDNVSVIAVTF